MYIGSNAFRTANGRAIQKHRIRGTIDDIPFTGANVLTGSFSISNSCSDESDFSVGAVFVGEFSCTFLRNLTVTPTTWKGRTITIFFGLCIDEDEDTWEEYKVGVFTVDEAQIAADGVTVTCYDAMVKFDTLLPTDFIASGSVYDIAKSVCHTCGVEFGMTMTECATLPNGDKLLGSYTPNDCQTYRDIIFFLSQTVGGFATINRNGELVFRSYSGRSTAILDVGASRRVQGATFSDFVVDFDMVTFENPDGTTEAFGSMSTGATFEAGFNPFLQFGTDQARQALRQNVADVITGVSFTPFTVELMSAPVFELGDVLDFSGGILTGQGKTGIVQAIDWTLNAGMTIRGFGSNPAYQNVQSASEAANSAAKRAENSSEMIYKDYVNITPISVTSDPIKVVDIYFSTNKVTDVEMWHEIQLQTLRASGNDDMTVQAVYYMDQIEISRKPIETFDDDAFHILDLHYYKPIEEIGSHRWEVYLVASGGTASIRANDAIAVLKGQGISKADSWTGVIILEDYIEPPFMRMSVVDLSDSVSVSLHENDMIQVEDDIETPFMSMFTAAMTDEVTVTLYTPKKQIVTEDQDYNIVTEDGDNNITTE